MRALRVVLTAPAFDEDLGFLQRIEEFPVQELIPQLCSVMLSLRHASTTPSPLPSSISMVRNCPMISSAVYRFRAMPPPFAGRKRNSRSGLVYRGPVNDLRHCASTNLRRAGVDTATAIKIVGHKSEKLWKRYNVIDERDLTQAAQKVHKYLQENTPGTLAETLADYSARK